MASFTDSKNRRHEFEITVDSINQVRSRTGINLYTLLDNDLAGLRELHADPGKVASILWHLCHGCGDGEPAMSEREFCRGLAGASLGDATEAFLEEYLNFFPNRRAATALREMMKKSATAGEMLAAEAMATIARTTPEALVQRLRDGYGSAPASSASTPAVTGSANS